MGKFKSINYSRVVCEDCNAETIIEPGREFSGLNCECKDPSDEVAKQYKDITVWTDGEVTVEALGEFENGDIEIKHVDGTLSYRIPAQTFITTFERVRLTQNEEIELVESEEGKIFDESGSVEGQELELKTPNYGDMSYEELKEAAKEAGIKKPHKIKKVELIQRLENGED